MSPLNKAINIIVSCSLLGIVICAIIFSLSSKTSWDDPWNVSASIVTETETLLSSSSDVGCARLIENVWSLIILLKSLLSEII